MPPRSRTPSIIPLLFAVRGTIMPVIWRRLAYAVVLSLLVTLLDLNYGWFRGGLNATPLTLMGLTLAIFLGFRNTVAYQRWWEARTLWGELVIVARDLARQAVTFTPQASHEARRRLVHRVIAFVHALRHHLRGSDPEADLAPWLHVDEVSRVLAMPNRASALVARVGEAYAQAMRAEAADPVLIAANDAKVGQLSHVLAGCERIQNTPIPFSYILLLHRSVHVYVFLLPFCLVGLTGWFTPVAVAILAYTFFGLDALGDQIEDPFDVMPNDLPLDIYTANIQRDLLALLGADTEW